MTEARTQKERMDLIRKEKFDIVLPKALRENNVDMWIHVSELGNPDPLAQDLGGSNGYFVFTDRGDERIERAVLGGDEDELRETGVYDLFGSKSDLGNFVAERDPQRIAVNMSENLAIADGLSHTGYLKLTEALDKKYRERLISAEQVITSFRTRRVISEIVEYGRLCEITRQSMERSLSNEVITPGVTTLEDIMWWFEDQLQDLGMEHAIKFFTPDVVHSNQCEEQDYRRKDYIIQRGDLLKYDNGISFMNLGSDVKRYAYVLEEGETTVPSGMQNAWEKALNVREVIRKNIAVGKTPRETMKDIGATLEEAGFEYIHLKTDPAKGGLPSLEPEEDTKKDDGSWVTLDCHCVGNSGDSEIACGPSMAGFRQDRADITIKNNNLFAFEFVVGTPVPEWNGWKWPLNIEDDAIVTEDGVQWLYPPNERILLIK